MTETHLFDKPIPCLVYWGSTLLATIHPLLREGNASLKRGRKLFGLTPPQTGLLKTLESGFIDSYGSCTVSQNHLSKASLLDLGQSAVAALKFFSAASVAGSN